MITQIDIDRLHQRPKVGKGSGKSFDLAVEVLQNIYFAEPGDEYVVRIPKRNYIAHMMPMYLQLSRIMEVDIEGISGKIVFFKNKAKLVFTTLDDNLDGRQCIEFIDS